MSILIGVVLNKTTSNAQNTIAESVIEYCEKHVIDNKTILWNGDALINCLFFNEEINKDFDLNTYRELSGRDKFIGKFDFFLENLNRLEFVKTDSLGESWIMKVRFKDRSFITARLIEKNDLITDRSLELRMRMFNFNILTEKSDTLGWDFSDIKLELNLIHKITIYDQAFELDYYDNIEIGIES